MVMNSLEKENFVFMPVGYRYKSGWWGLDRLDIAIAERQLHSK